MRMTKPRKRTTTFLPVAEMLLHERASRFTDARQGRELIERIALLSIPDAVTLLRKEVKP